MRHRHLTTRAYTLAAIDSVIGRGRLRDWLALCRAARREPELLGKIERVCRAHEHDPYEAQLYARWRRWVRRQRERRG